MKLSEKDKISNLDLYRILGFDNPQKLYDNWVKQMRDPMELAKDANDAVDNAMLTLKCGVRQRQAARQNR
jgi:hypothetical protein